MNVKYGLQRVRFGYVGPYIKILIIDRVIYYSAYLKHVNDVVVIWPVVNHLII